MLSCHRCRQTLAYPHWQQLHPWLLLSKSSCQVEPSPAKQLVGVHPVRPRYPCHRRPLHQRLFDDPSLLRYAPPLSPRYERGLSALGNDCNLLGSVHLRSKWTQSLSVHFASMALTYGDVQTSTTGRLPSNTSAPITIQAAQNRTVIITGSNVWTG